MSVFGSRLSFVLAAGVSLSLVGKKNKEPGLFFTEIRNSHAVFGWAGGGASDSFLN